MLKPSVSELEGFKIGDSVRLKIKGVAEDHEAEMISFNVRKKEFKVMLKSKSCTDGNGIWIAWLNELEKVTA